MATEGSDLAVATKMASLSMPSRTMSVDTTPLTPPRADLPLPRELRDHIWSYLLSGEHVKAAPYHTRKDRVDTTRAGRTLSTAHTYRFETAVLAVNHAIHDEANKVLKQNDFVVISAIWPNITLMKYKWGLPVVTDNQDHVAKFNRHTVRMHLQHPQRDLEPKDRRVRSMLILAGDLPDFCEMMQWQLSCTTAFWPQIVGCPEGLASKCYTVMLSSTPSSIGRARIQLQIRSDGDKPVTPGLENLLLQNMGVMVCPGQKVVGLESLSDQKRVQATKRLMTPNWVWPNAVACSMLEAAQKLKRKADDLVRQGDFSRACDRYLSMLEVMESRLMIYIPPHLPEYDTLERTMAKGLLCRTILDGLTTAGFIFLNTEDLIAAERAERAVSKMMQRMRESPSVVDMGFLPDGEAALLVHPEADWFVRTLDFVLASNFKGSDAEQALAKCRSNLRLTQSVIPWSEYLETDIQLIEEASQDDQVGSYPMAAMHAGVNSE